ncbi:hypothetical protein PRIPAC_80191 [Pristionchus pacificus]|uniref:G protein-coupled receptor n=1 Tax=Pristionchus pacificus TaxID=54126 RepID=A0A2A6C1R9_PRIPA|nr:hypothetical protein PRIPAC_80191 [Pristionchus pacificus]|eukprot:PDM72114.1 G protein-coupled receptor [Pristionchus pacificus]
MLASDEIQHISILAVLDCTALVLNSLLIVAIATRTPPSLHAYEAVCEIIRQLGTAQKYQSSETLRFGVLEGADDDRHPHFDHRCIVDSRRHLIDRRLSREGGERAREIERERRDREEVTEERLLSKFDFDVTSPGVNDASVVKMRIPIVISTLKNPESQSFRGLIFLSCARLNRICLILSRTPSYSVLLLNTAIVDWTASIILRFINVECIMVLVYIGPCTFYGSKFCHAMQCEAATRILFHAIHFAAVIVGLMGHSYILLLISVSYRLWVIRVDILPTSSGMRGRLWKVAIISICPSFVMMIAIYNSASYSVSSVDAALPNAIYSAIILRSFTITSEENFLSRLTVLLSACFFNGCIVGTALVRIRLLRRIKSLEEMGFMIPRLVKCQKCGWKYADCELGPIPESSKSKWTCTDCISFWNVPKWGGIETTPEGDKIIHNTCALDSFLATLISQHRLDPRLFEKIGTASLFEKYLRSMLMDGNIDQVKDELIKKIFSNKIDKKGRYDMWASECEILDRLFEYSSKLLFNLKYRTCSERKKLTRCHFETQKKGDSMKQVVYDSILGQSDCQSCQGSRQILNVTSTAWFIPVDISLQKESPSRCDEIGEYKFELGGITLFGGGHYVALIPRDNKWILYDGIKTVKMRYINPRTIQDHDEKLMYRLVQITVKQHVLVTKKCSTPSLLNRSFHSQSLRAVHYGRSTTSISTLCQCHLVIAESFSKTLIFGFGKTRDSQMSSFFALGSPIINLTFLRPYRKSSV